MTIRGRLSVQTVEVHGEVLEQYSYTYDQWGNISGITHETGRADADGTSTDAGTAGTDADGRTEEERYCNPDIKRFINQDILTGNISNSASLNRYGYVDGNPVSYTDPFWLSPFDYFTDRINVSSIIHSTLDILGTLTGGWVFYIINSGVYIMEGNWSEAIKSLEFVIPGMNLLGKSTK